MSDIARAEKTESLQQEPHWEPVWSREYMVDYLIYKYERGEDLAPWTVYRFESAVHANIKKYFGSYRAGVEAAGIDYKAIRVIDLTESWTKEKVIERIRKLHRKKPLSSTTEIRLRDSRLYDSCHRYYGGAVPAMEAAGIPYASLDAKRWKYWNKNNVIDTIHSLDRCGLSLRPSAVKGHLDGQAAEFLAAAEDIFGSWEVAVAKAGINLKKHRGKRSAA